MSANDKSRVPIHYASDYLHWDLVLVTGMDYLTANATKYLARWRLKGGKQDLVKALHYAEKAKENAVLLARSQTRPALSWVRAEASRFCDVNKIGEAERVILIRLATWLSPDDLSETIAALQRFIGTIDTIDSTKMQQLVDPKEVPATDSNKHAERS